MPGERREGRGDEGGYGEDEAKRKEGFGLWNERWGGMNQGGPCERACETQRIRRNETNLEGFVKLKKCFFQGEVASFPLSEYSISPGYTSCRLLTNSPCNAKLCKPVESTKVIATPDDSLGGKPLIIALGNTNKIIKLQYWRFFLVPSSNFLLAVAGQIQRRFIVECHGIEENFCCCWKDNHEDFQWCFLEILCL